MSQKKIILLEIFVSLCAGGIAFFSIQSFFSLLPQLRPLASGVAYGPWIEEGVKFLMAILMLRIAYIKPIMIPFIGISFGLLEAINRYVNDRLVSVIPFWMHIIVGLVMTYFLYLTTHKKQYSLRSVWYSLAFLIPVCIHHVYNIFLARWFVFVFY
jgi:hypothetical protein